MKQQFNIDEELELIKQGARIDGKGGVLALLIKQLTEQFSKQKLNLIYLQRLIIVNLQRL